MDSGGIELAPNHLQRMRHHLLRASRGARYGHLYLHTVKNCNDFWVLAGRSQSCPHQWPFSFHDSQELSLVFLWFHALLSSMETRSLKWRRTATTATSKHPDRSPDALALQRTVICAAGCCRVRHRKGWASCWVRFQVDSWGVSRGGPV